jgi:hypothetical protein
MKKILIPAIFFVLILASRGACLAKEENAKCLESIEILAGFSSGELVRGQRSYMMAPLSVAFDFNLKNLTKKIGFDPAQLLQFQVEPFIGFITSPKNNLEAGTIFWLKIGLFPDTWKFQPYGKLGVGLDYMTAHIRQQSTQFNFTEQAALGAHYYFTKNTAFTLEGRLRHLSNSGIKEPNHGFNSYSLLTGISYRF